MDNKKLYLEVLCIRDVSKNFLGYDVYASPDNMSWNVWASYLGDLKDDIYVLRCNVLGRKEEIAEVFSLKKANKILHKKSCEFARSYKNCHSLIIYPPVYSKEEVSLVSVKD
ncbi:MAG: hypothetical protein ABFQ65_04240 [Nanoarchaeota archaeon]